MNACCIVIIYSLFISSRSLDSIPENLLGLFRDSAEGLIEERGAVDVVAAALAHMSGAREITSRSLLSSHQVGGADHAHYISEY